MVPALVVGMFFLALFCTILWGMLPSDGIDRELLPPEGFTRLATVHGYDSLDQLAGVESTWVERGDGLGIRIRQQYRQGESQPYSGVQEVGIANGYAVADTERIVSWEQGVLVESRVRTRIPSALGAIWVGPDRDHDTLEIRLNQDGREAYRRTVSWAKSTQDSGFSTVTDRMEWEGNHLLRWDDVHVRNQTDTTFHETWTYEYQGDERVGISVVTIYFSATIPPDTLVNTSRHRWESDSIRLRITTSTRSSTRYSNEVITPCRVTRDSLGLPLLEVAGEGAGGIGWADTTQWIRDESGQILFLRSANRRFRSVQSTLYDGSMRKLSERSYTQEDSTTPHPVTLDSTDWSDGTKVRDLRYRCLAPGSQEACVLVWRTEYAQLLQAQPTTARRRPAMPLRVRRAGQVVRWTGPVPDGATATLRTLDGRILGVATFHAGVAEAAPASSCPAVWTLDAAGRTLASGRLSSSR